MTARRREAFSSHSCFRGPEIRLKYKITCRPSHSDNVSSRLQSISFQWTDNMDFDKITTSRLDFQQLFICPNRFQSSRCLYCLIKSVRETELASRSFRSESKRFLRFDLNISLLAEQHHLTSLVVLVHEFIVQRICCLWTTRRNSLQFQD